MARAKRLRNNWCQRKLEKEGPDQIRLLSLFMSFCFYPKTTRNRDDMIKSACQNLKGLVKRRLWIDQLGDLYTGQVREILPKQSFSHAVESIYFRELPQSSGMPLLSLPPEHIYKKTFR